MRRSDLKRESIRAPPRHTDGTASGWRHIAGDRPASLEMERCRARNTGPGSVLFSN